MATDSGSASELAYQYFPTDYRWSMGLLLALCASPWKGAEIDEINRIGAKLQDRVGDDAAWVREWTGMARKLEDIGHERAREGNRLSGSNYLLRASQYYHIGERFAHPKDDAALALYKRGVAAFKSSAEFMLRPKIESVEIPYENSSLPALFVHADPVPGMAGPSPCMVFFDGLDVTKELQYCKGVADLAARGIACLLVDGPGNGEAIRFRGMPLRPDTESYGTAAYEYLAGRREIDPKRIGVMAISLGGYFAPRAASLERRFAACVAWGAIWDYARIWRQRFEKMALQQATSLSVPWQHFCWAFGVETKEEALAKAEAFKLDGVVQQMTCPFLLLHGEGDKQVPLSDAQLCLDAVGSKDKTLKVFTREEGGFHHCQLDNMTIGVDYMWDWVARVLGGAR